MFIQKIIICNLLAYYGRVEVNFTQMQDKNIYCIYGKNGFGKTSFINCARLLFLGSGLLDENAKIPEIISRLTKNVRVPSAKAFMLGAKNWDGVLNKKASMQKVSEYFIEFCGEINGENFSIKRKWEKPQGKNEIIENLQYNLGNRFYENDSAQIEINKILPPNFVEFFFFNGEEIESMSENLRTSLKEKISIILQIAPLSVIIKQSDIMRNELKHTQLQDLELKNKHIEKNKELEILNLKLENAEKEIKYYENLISQKRAQCECVESEKRKLIINQTQIYERLESKSESLQEKMQNAKDKLPRELESIVFSVNKELVEKLEQEINKSDSKEYERHIEGLINLFSDMKEVINEELSKVNETTKNSLINYIFSMPKKLASRREKKEKIPSNLIKEIKDSIPQIKNNNLSNTLAQIRDAKIELKNIESKKENLNLDDSTKEREESLNTELKELNDDIKILESKLHSKKYEHIEFTHNIKNAKSEIITKNNATKTQNTESSIEILNLLKYCISSLKNKEIVTLKIALKKEILKNYKTIMPDDNVSDLEINDDFEIVLKDAKNGVINVISQSSGQKQILSIAIFWALSELSNSKMPLIIDTPLSRIDRDNRLRIIKHYYAKAQNQVIILPTDTEISPQEYNYIKPHLAQIYHINKAQDREHASISMANITDIFES